MYLHEKRLFVVGLYFMTVIMVTERVTQSETICENKWGMEKKRKTKGFA